jgi:hypothetical protein
MGLEPHALAPATPSPQPPFPVNPTPAPEALATELAALQAAEVSLTVAVRLYESDLAAMTVSADVGDALLPFVQWDS